MKKVFKDAYAEAKKLPKGLWAAAVVVPGGLATITVYLAVKSVYHSVKKGKKNDRGENHQG